jgi:flagellar biosynthesis protein FlhG
MLPDQANDLRNLVLRTARGIGASDAPPPKLVVVTGGKGGVGTTTVAVNLAASLAGDGQRVVLVDADFAGPNVAEQCGLDDAYGAADVLAGRRTVHEVLLRGPMGIQVLPTHRGSVEPGDCSPQAQERLLTQLHGLGAHADYVLVDAGSGSSRVMRRFWEAADGVLLVVQSDSASVMDAYALVKLVCNENPPPAPIAAIVNGAEAEAADVLERLNRACRRFLGFTITAAGHVPHDAGVAQASVAGKPLLLHSPQNPLVAAYERLAAEMTSLVVTPPAPHIVFRRSPPSQAR